MKAEKYRKEKKRKMSCRKMRTFSREQLLKSGLNEFEGKRTTLELLELAGKKGRID